MSFSNIGSAEGEFAGVTGATDTVSAAVPSLGANRIGIVAVLLQVGAERDVTGVTWNGNAMTDIPGAHLLNTATAQVAALFYLVGMAHNGTYDIVVTWNNTTARTAHVVVIWADATNEISLDDSSEEEGTAQNPDIISTQSGADELVISASVTDNNGAVNAPTGATTLQDYDSGGNCSCVAYSTPASSGDATHTHNYAQAASSNYVIVSASFKEAAGGGGGTILPQMMEHHGG